MSYSHKHVKKVLEQIEKVKSIEAYTQQIAPLTQEEIDKLDRKSFNGSATTEGLEARLSFLAEQGVSVDRLTSHSGLESPESLKGNIENFIGMAQVPVGLAGPLLVKGSEAQGDFFVPLATTEGALIASYNRGMKACRLSGGITSVCLIEGVQRSPFFKFDNLGTVGLFIKWVYQRMDKFTEIVESTSRFAKLNDLKANIEGNSVILTFEYLTGDAAGQNMVTICTDKICKYILANFDITPLEWYIEGNYSGDKKATTLSFVNVRGKKVTAEIVIPRFVVDKVLKTTPEKIAQYWQSSTLGVIQSGAIGAQGHVANGLTALFIACGQDVACISESSIGLTRMETNTDGDLYVSVTLPSLIVGTVGGGTSLATQKECLEMLGCAGANKAKKFAEICCAVALAGEISIASAMSADHFTNAHQKLGRK
ncbi:hydroxymethylglutaryl-CoA reductase [Microscilla marina]|uniref:hydroxymethylglutaryl-CoA reductase (NADPH) n=1 Tax=Microscilla marina ATCC 23134 TaxID=313606 RepID=A1ZZS8_MICM2|nr:hydroxymethylglutaryl-CoA reductase [Microscilla marina]EAY24089.1 hydroxymethylglutaryl-coenzyme A reductase [Microscilla marina ATCC 23134]